MSGEHTPVPWKIGRYEEVQDAAGQIIRVVNFALQGSDEARANTAFIVRAVNSHSALVEALSELVAALDRDYPDDSESYDASPVDFFGECGSTALTYGHIRAARLALSTARTNGGEIDA